MTSSTSSSSLPRARGALCCAALLVALVALWRTDGAFATAPAWYWRMKLEWQHAADIALVGDSQVYRGLAPEVFAKAWDGRALNFGFSSYQSSRSSSLVLISNAVGSYFFAFPRNHLSEMAKQSGV